MRNFKQNQHKLSNNHVQFSNRNLLCKFEPPSKKSWIRPCFYHLFYLIYMGQPIWDPYGTRLHCPYGSHTGAHMGPIWVSYRLLAGFFKRQMSAKPECSRGGVSIFFCMRKLEPRNPGRFAPKPFPPLVVSPPRRFPPGRFPPGRFAPISRFAPLVVSPP